MNNLFQKLKDRWVLILFGAIVVYSIYGLMKGQLKEYYLNNSSDIIIGIIINEKNFFVNNTVAKDFSYSYQFLFEGKKYKNDSQERNLKIGDSVMIEYYQNYPKFNRFLKQKK